jgi:hypothetical protein
MRSLGIVIDAPGLADSAGILEGEKPVLVEALGRKRR